MRASIFATAIVAGLTGLAAEATAACQCITQGSAACRCVSGNGYGYRNYNGYRSYGYRSYGYRNGYNGYGYNGYRGYGYRTYGYTAAPTTVVRERVIIRERPVEYVPYGYGYVATDGYGYVSDGYRWRW